MWWAENRSRADVECVLDGSEVVVGLCTESDELVGFTRVLSDGACRAFVYDVIVAPAYRGQGVGTRVVEELLTRPAVASAEQVELYCQPDLVACYERWEFSDDLDVRLVGESSSTRTPRRLCGGRSNRRT